MSRPVSNTALLATVAQLGKPGRATKVTALNILNPAVAITFIQMFDASAVGDVTIGTTVPDMALAVAIGGVLDWSGIDRMFGKGLVISATTTATGLTAPSAANVVNAAIDDG